MFYFGDKITFKNYPEEYTVVEVRTNGRLVLVFNGRPMANDWNPDDFTLVSPPRAFTPFQQRVQEYLCRTK